MPGKNRASSNKVLLFLKDLRERLTIVSLTEEEYVEALQNASNMGIMGSSIYDAVLAYCAMKVKAEAIYTWNIKHFRKLGADLASRLNLFTRDGKHFADECIKPFKRFRPFYQIFPE